MFRKPDFIVGGEAAPYLRRWHILPRNRFVNIYLHHFLRSDDARALHDHPYANLSILLKGSYREHTVDGKVHTRRRFSFISRRATHAHRIELFGGEKPLPAWTLFLTGPRIREWGFLCDKGRRWVHWRDFTKPDEPGSIGRRRTIEESDSKTQAPEAGKEDE